MIKYVDCIECVCVWVSEREAIVKHFGIRKARNYTAAQLEDVLLLQFLDAAHVYVAMKDFFFKCVIIYRDFQNRFEVNSMF